MYVLIKTLLSLGIGDIVLFRPLMCVQRIKKVKDYARIQPLFQIEASEMLGWSSGRGAYSGLHPTREKF